MRGFLKLVAWVVGILAAICLVLYVFFFDVWTIPVDDPTQAVSIQPTLQAGDLVVFSRHGTPGRGNLVRCPDPRAGGRFVIGRVMAIAPEQIQFNGEYVSIDNSRNPSPRACPGATLRDPNTGEDVELSCSVEEFAQMSYEAFRGKNRVEPPRKSDVASGVYLVSDNRHMHDDSRDFEPVNPTSCQHIVFRLWGAAGFGDTKHRMNVIW